MESKDDYQQSWFFRQQVFCGTHSLDMRKTTTPAGTGQQLLRQNRRFFKEHKATIASESLRGFGSLVLLHSACTYTAVPPASY
jgi:hypothetical protein